MNMMFQMGGGMMFGGLMDDGFKYIIANKGIDSEADYNYTASTSPTKRRSTLWRCWTPKIYSIASRIR